MGGVEKFLRTWSGLNFWLNERILLVKYRSLKFLKDSLSLFSHGSFEYFH